MRLRLQAWLRRRSTKGLALLVLTGVAVIFLVGGGVYAVLGGVGKQQAAGDIELQRGLVGWWRFDGNAKDRTPYGDNGTVTNATLTTDREGKANSAYNFNGTNAVIMTGNNNALSITGNLTISAWVNITNDGNYQPIVTKNTVEYELAADFRSGATILQLRNGSGNITAANFFSGGYTGTWVHIVVTTDGTNTKMYRNGTLFYSSGYIAPSTGSDTVGLGSRSTGSSLRFNGSMDDVRIYKRALSAAEITALYSQYDPGVNAASGENGLVGWWKLNGNAKDSTPYANNGTATGSPAATTDREGAANSAYNFNGTSDSFTFAGPTLSTNATISGWFNFVGASTAVLFRDHTGANGWLLYQSGTNFIFRLGGTQYSTGISVTPYLSKWTHFALTKSGGNVAFYINGTSVYTSTGAANTATVMPWHLMENGTTSTYTAGAVSDFRIYNRALSASEVNTLANTYNSQISLNSSPTNNQTVNLNSGLVGYWPFNGNAKDITPYSDNGTVTGASVIADRKSRASSAYSFNGTSNNITVPTTNLPSAKITVSAWVNQSTLVNWYDIVSNNWGGGGVVKGWDLYVTSTGTVLFGLWNNTESQFNASCANALTTNSWHLFTGTFDGTTVRAYFDGVLCGTTATPTGSLTLSTTNAATFRIGEVGGGSSTHFIDDVRIYNRALSGTEIQSLYSNYY